MSKTSSGPLLRLAIVVSHPIQYYSPIFRDLAERLELHVFYGQLASNQQQAAAGFGVGFDWDVDLMGGYSSSLLRNCAAEPDLNTFNGCDVPSLKSEIAAFQPDAVLVFGWYQKVFLQAVWAAKSLDIPVLVRGDSHLGMPGSGLRQVGKKAIYPFLLRVFDAALYVGRHSREYYNHFRYPKDRLFFSPHCVDTVRFKEASTGAARQEQRATLGVAEDIPLVLFAGKLLPFKRPLDFIAGLAHLRQNGLPAEAMIAGSGPMEHEVKAFAASLNVPVHYLGFCNQSVMPIVYAAADSLVLPSTGRETWGLVCNEALACGTPIVVSDQVGCAPDLAADGRAGQIFTMGDCNALAAALAKMLRHPPNPQLLSALSERYSISAAVEGVMRAIEATVTTVDHRAR